jgi:hypothetical protein
MDLRKKQQLFPYTALIGFYNGDGPCLLGGVGLIFTQTQIISVFNR